MKKVLVVDDSRSWVKYHKENIISSLPNSDRIIDIDVAYSAREGYDWVYNMIADPYDVIITDLHMELDFEPKYAGEWLVEQIRLLKQYNNTKIIICSAAYNIKTIASNFGVQSAPKSVVSRNPEFYKNLF